MANEQDREAADTVGSSSSPSKGIVEPGSLPGGRSSAAERRVGARRVLTAAEQEALVRELETSGARVPAFAATHGFHASTMYAWRRRLRAGEPMRRGGVRG